MIIILFVICLLIFTCLSRYYDKVITERGVFIIQNTDAKLETQDYFQLCVHSPNYAGLCPTLAGSIHSSFCPIPSKIWGKLGTVMELTPSSCKKFMINLSIQHFIPFLVLHLFKERVDLKWSGTLWSFPSMFSTCLLSMEKLKPKKIGRASCRERV